MNSKARDPLPVAALVLGVLASLVGLWLIAAYFFSAVFARWGEPDQSLLFWYLPLLFVGSAILVPGLCAVLWGIIRRRQTRLSGRDAK